jgi:hypothetical protein
MLNNPYSSSAMVSASLPTLINTVSSSSYTFTQSSGTGFGAPQTGNPYGQPNPYTQPVFGQSPMVMAPVQQQPIPMSVPVAAPYPQPGMAMAPPVSRVFIQPARIVTGYTQGVYRAYIPPIVTTVPPYPVHIIRRPMPAPMMFAPRVF